MHTLAHRPQPPGTSVSPAKPAPERAHDRPASTAKSPLPASVFDVAATSGQPLDPAVRSLMEPRFNFNFGHVRVHSGGEASASARALKAAAYTVGPSIVFAEGQYDPGSHQGGRLLAHELAHVVQTRHAPVVPLGQLQVAHPFSSPENEAGRAADAFLNPAARLAASAAPLAIYRDPPKPPPPPAAPSRRIIYLDASIIIEIERGNVAAANTLKSLLRTDEVRMSDFTRKQLVDNLAWKESAGAHKILIEDLRISVWAEATPEKLAHTTAKNQVGSAKRPITAIDAGDLGLVAAVPDNAELWTLDKKLVRNQVTVKRQFGVTFSPESTSVPNVERVGPEAPPPDYATGRALLGLDPILVDNTGKLEQRGRQASVTKAGATKPVEHPSGKTVTGEINNNDRLPPEPGPGKPPVAGGGAGGPGGPGPAPGGAGGAGGVTASAPVTTVKPAGSIPLEGPPPVTARDLAIEMRSTETTNRRMAQLATFARWGLEAYNFLGVLEQIAGALNLAASTLAGGPLQKEKQQAIDAVANAKGLADYYDSLDFLKNIPAGGWEAFDGGWSALQQIQFDYYETESHLHDALDAVDGTLKNIGHQIQDLADAVTKKTAALVLTPVSTPYGEVYLFADAAGQLRSHLIDAANEYARAHRALLYDLGMVRASIKFMEIKLRHLGVSGLVDVDVDTDDLKTADLDKFTLRH